MAKKETNSARINSAISAPAPTDTIKISLAGPAAIRKATENSGTRVAQVRKEMEASDRRKKRHDEAAKLKRRSSQLNF